MVMINSSKHAENMFCLEFDFQNHRIDQSVSEEERRMNRRFRVIDQYMIESMLDFKIQGSCHGMSLFRQYENNITFSISGKKMIKSIQNRILSLKDKLSKVAEKIHK